MSSPAQNQWAGLDYTERRTMLQKLGASKAVAKTLCKRSFEGLSLWARKAFKTELQKKS